MRLRHSILYSLLAVVAVAAAFAETVWPLAVGGVLIFASVGVWLSSRWPLMRTMHDKFYQAGGHAKDKPAGHDAGRSHRTFASASGGHLARFAGLLKSVVGHGAGGRMRLQLSRSATA